MGEQFLFVCQAAPQQDRAAGDGGEEAGTAVPPGALLHQPEVKWFEEVGSTKAGSKAWHSIQVRYQDTRPPHVIANF